MIIKIDYRERDLIEMCQNLIVSPKVSSKLTILTENLHVGDIVITETNKQGEELLIIERKSLNDLAASIKDGRYSEQSFRLNQYPTHNHHIVYLIEGNLSTWKQYGYGGRIITKDTLYSSLTSILYYKGFSVMRTMSMEESAQWIVRSALKLEKEKSKRTPFYKHINTNTNINTNTSANTNANTNTTVSCQEDNSKKDSGKMVLDMKKEIEPPTQSQQAQSHPDMNYTSVMKAVKRNNITIDNIGSIMIMQIPGISSTIANTIMSHFENIGDLIENLHTNPSCLDTIYCTTKTGKKRKLSKSIRENLFYYLGNNKHYEEKNIQIV